MGRVREVLAVLLIVAMFAVATRMRQKEFIFPELAALVLGAWVMETPPWRCTFLSLWLSPTLAALTGTLLVRYGHVSPVLLIVAAFTLVMAQLKLMRSAILPAISAAILPVITRSDSWEYPCAVCLMTGVIASGRQVMFRSGLAGYGRELAEERPVNLSGDGAAVAAVKHGGALLAGVLAVSAMAYQFHLLFMAAPPLFVAFVELARPEGGLRRRALEIVALLVFAAFSGVLWLQLITNGLHLPVWFAACLSTTSVFLLYRFMRLTFPPAVAIALLPTIIPPRSLWAYPLHVLVGSLAFVAISTFWFGRNDPA